MFFRQKQLWPSGIASPQSVRRKPNGLPSRKRRGIKPKKLRNKLYNTVAILKRSLASVLTRPKYNIDRIPTNWIAKLYFKCS